METPKTRTTRLELTHEAREILGAKAMREGKSMSQAASELIEEQHRQAKSEEKAA